MRKEYVCSDEFQASKTEVDKQIAKCMYHEVEIVA
jgi:hypothetical protein